MYSNPVRLNHQAKDISEMTFSEQACVDDEMRLGKFQKY